MITSIPALAISRVMRRPVKALSSRSASLLAASPAARSVPGWRSPMAAGPGDRARTMRVPRSVRMARRKPSNHSAGAPCPAEPGVQVVARAGPLPGAADPRGMPDRDRGGIDLLDGISGYRGCAGGAELLESTRSQRVRR